MRLWRASVRSTSRSRGSSPCATVVITQRGDGSVSVSVAPPSRALRLRHSFSTKPDAAVGPVSITRLGRNRRVVIVLSGASVGEGGEARGGDEVQRGEVDEAVVGGRHGHGQVDGDVGQQDVVDLGPVALVDVVGATVDSSRTGRPRWALSAASAAARSAVPTARPAIVTVTSPVASSRAASSSSSAVATFGCLALRILPVSRSRSARRRSPGIPDGVISVAVRRAPPIDFTGNRQISLTNPTGASAGTQA